MEFLSVLWLPLLLSAVFVFLVSSVLHMLVPIHKGDWQKLAGEDAVMDFLREQGVRPGQYMFPACGDMKDMKSPEQIAKFSRGPVGHLTIIPSGPPSMNKSLVQWFLHTLLVGVFVAYLCHHALAPGASYLAVFRLAGTSAFLAYGVGVISDSIWKGQPWCTTLKFVFDGLVYGLVTAGTFAWQWPDAPV